MFATHLLGQGPVARDIDRGSCSHPPIWANARVELERAQTNLSAETVQTRDKGTDRARLQHVVRPDSISTSSAGAAAQASAR